jgi:hypothetical protein
MLAGTRDWPCYLHHHDYGQSHFSHLSLSLISGPVICGVQVIEDRINKVLDKPRKLRYYANHDEHQ